MGKRFFTFLISAFLICSSCFARQISVQVVQHDLSLDYVSEQSLIVEDELLNGFFDQGYIVTNSEASISDSEERDNDLFHFGYGEAYDGASDYFVQVKLFYDAANKKSKMDVTPCKLDHIDLVVINVSSGKTIKESTIKGIEKSNTDDSVRLLSTTLIKEIRKAL